ncbi:hypothetical protein ABLE91_13040 [Aquabacter sp. CN5-332]|uniref:alginate O-acetyltransferase AlgX-related protein n=1 Tax=Aquabacter sp. CN5-332 TaxID=3156608 RepID=UPI0032B60499
MPLLLRYRRYMGLLVMGIIGALLLSNLIPDPSGRYIWRGGQKGPDALWIERAHGQLQRLAFYLQDNFGFRASLPLVRTAIRDWANSPENGLIYVGRYGQLLWAGQNAAAQSAGSLLRKEAVERFAALMMALQRELAPEGTKVVVALPPNAQSVDLEQLPEWQDRFPAQTTEYSMLLDELKVRGVTAVDLRAVLRASPDSRRYLANDTHWTNLSSVLSFNAIMRAAGHPDWQVNVSEVVGPRGPYILGDLARTLRRSPPLPDTNQSLRLKEAGLPSPFVFYGRHEAKAFNGHGVRYADHGPRVLIIGDSYTLNTWVRLFAYTPVAEAAWMHISKTTYGSCDFDFADVKRFKPDLLIVARAERVFPCLNGAWPDHLPSPD